MGQLRARQGIARAGDLRSWTLLHPRGEDPPFDNELSFVIGPHGRLRGSPRATRRSKPSHSTACQMEPASSCSTTRGPLGSPEPAFLGEFRKGPHPQGGRPRGLRGKPVPTTSTASKTSRATIKPLTRPCDRLEALLRVLEDHQGWRWPPRPPAAREGTRRRLPTRRDDDRPERALAEAAWASHADAEAAHGVRAADQRRHLGAHLRLAARPRLPLVLPRLAQSERRR